MRKKRKLFFSSISDIPLLIFVVRTCVFHIMPRGQSTSYKSKAANARELIQSNEATTGKAVEEYTLLKREEPLIHKHLSATLDKMGDVILQSSNDTWITEYAKERKNLSAKDVSSVGTSTVLANRIEIGVDNLLSIISAYSAIITELSESMTRTEEAMKAVLLSTSAIDLQLSDQPEGLVDGENALSSIGSLLSPLGVPAASTVEDFRTEVRRTRKQNTAF